MTGSFGNSAAILRSAPAFSIPVRRAGNLICKACPVRPISAEFGWDVAEEQSMKPKNDERTKLSAMVPRANVDALFRIAREHDKSVSAEVRAAVAEHVSKESAPAVPSFAARPSAPSERGDARAPRLAGTWPSLGAPDGSGPPAGTRPKEAV